MKPIDLTGQVFGLWTVLKRAPDRGDYIVRWVCRCSCGEVGERTSANLRRGMSLGCRKCRPRRVPGPGSALRGIWRGMKSRCERPSDPKYPRYGARGIKLCARWQTFDNFYADMCDRPSAQHTLERTNNDGDYEPGNVIWALPVEQSNNRSTSLRIEINGETQTLAQWARRHGVSMRRVWARMARGWSPLRALAEPAHKPGGDTRKQWAAN